MKRVASLRTALLYPLLWLWLLPALVATLAAFWLSGQAAEATFDRALKDDALALATQVYWDGSGPGFKADSATAASLVFDSLSPPRYTVYTESGKVLSGNAELTLPATMRPQRGTADAPIFFDTRTPWGVLRTVALRLRHAGDNESVWVLVGETRVKREQIGHELAAAIFLPAVFVGFVIVPLLFLGIRHGLAPAREISEAVARRSINDLSPLPLDKVPDELKSLIVRINDLLARLTEAIAHERRFIAEAAHQLRTPVTGIKLLAEDLVRSHREDPASPPDAEVLDELQAAASRTSHLVQLLLAMARAERMPTPVELIEIDLAELGKTVAARWAGIAAVAHKRLSLAPALTQSSSVRTRANPLLLEEALGNVIDNAIRYGGPEITLDLELTSAQAQLHVQDNGQPLPAETLANMFTPFWRDDNAPDGGTGLGLAIAQRTLRNLGGDLSVRSGGDLPGTRITLHLPLVASPTP